MKVKQTVYLIRKYRDDVVFETKELAIKMLDKIYKEYEKLMNKDKYSYTNLNRISNEHFSVNEHDGMGNFPTKDYEIEEIKLVDHTDVKDKWEEYKSLKK